MQSQQTGNSKICSLKEGAMKMDEGYIKFHCELQKTGNTIPPDVFSIINSWRTKMYSLNLIGAYENGIGFGNISVRVNGTSKFYISGTATGNFEVLSPEDYVLVNGYNFKNNSLVCEGQIQASSESLSHAAIFEADEEINAVIHIHNMEMWGKGLNTYPATHPEYSFGTPEIAMNIAKLLEKDSTRKNGIIIMGGHSEGILFFGKDLDEAGKNALKYFKELCND